MLVLSPKPLKKLTGTVRQADRQADGQDHVLSQADALAKNEDDPKKKKPQKWGLPKKEDDLKSEDYP